MLILWAIGVDRVIRESCYKVANEGNLFIIIDETYTVQFLYNANIVGNRSGPCYKRIML